MQRTLSRAYQRLRGNHPRRPDGNHAVELFCDAVLALGVLDFLAGVALIAWGCAAGFEPFRIIAGAVMLIHSPAVLWLWEKLAWEPFFERLAQAS